MFMPLSRSRLCHARTGPGHPCARGPSVLDDAVTGALDTYLHPDCVGVRFAAGRPHAGITANCSITNSTSVGCAAGARIGLAPCTNSWVGSTLPGIPDPRQIWSRGADTEPGALKLEYTWIASDHPKNKPAKKESTSCLTLVAN